MNLFVNAASMRPPEFTGGNPTVGGGQQRALHRFNEAAGIHRRKQQEGGSTPSTGDLASMRPPEFTGGNDTTDLLRGNPEEIALQ